MYGLILMIGWIVVIFFFRDNYWVCGGYFVFYLLMSKLLNNKYGKNSRELSILIYRKGIELQNELNKLESDVKEIQKKIEGEIPKWFF